LNSRGLIEFFDTRRQAGTPLVLVSVFETEGSTYSKAGAHMLIDENGIFQGMLSGGCLEGDLAIRAKVVVESGRTQTVTYDLGSSDDELWGLGVGCDGLMRMFLQPLTAKHDYQPFAAIAGILQGSTPAVVATVIESAVAEVATGAAIVLGDEHCRCFGVGGEVADSLSHAAKPTLADRTSRIMRLDIGGNVLVVLMSFVVPPPRILILGAGLDVAPLVRFCGELGWRSTIVDHRQAYIDHNDLTSVEASYCVPADDLASTVDLDGFDMAVVMSHHLASDRAYLRQLAPTDIGYVGLLGPHGRRERLLADLGSDSDKLRDRLHGPAGLDLGGRGPAPIALAIVAEMQKHWSG
jgi:xanthine/CO dehydrogenase XdhC/CoxF family maturation factor